MNLGRRSFIKFIASAMAGAQVDAMTGVYRSPELYVDEKLGFAFKIPPGWHMEAFRADFRELLGGQKLAEPYRDDEEVIEELSQNLMATLSKYPIVGDDQHRFSPSVTFFKGSDGEMEEEQTLLDFVERAHEGFGMVLTDYECTERPEYTKLKDGVMVRSKSKFLFEHEKLKSVMVDDECYVIHHERSIYTLHLYDSPYSNDISQKEFDLFRESLHIV